MASVGQMQQVEVKAPSARSELALLCAIAGAFAVLHIATNGRYGFHRDELQFLSDARHLDWGFVAYPPLTPFLERLAFELFGLSLVGLRLFSVIAQAIVVLVSGLMARDLGGARLAQVAAALSVGLSGVPLFEGTEFQYTSFSYCLWILVCWFTIRLLRSGNPRWWIAIGAAIGFGLFTKYAVAFYVAGLIAGLLLSPARGYLRTRWLWAGAGLALLITLPNLVWLARHDFISYQFLQHIHARDVGQGRASGYWKYQIFNLSPVAIPLWIAGLVACFRSSRYRILGWISVVPLLLFWVGKGRFYYAAEAYPAAVAMGAVVAERWLAGRTRRVRPWVTAAFLVALLGAGAYFVAFFVPLASGGPLREFALKNSSDLREEIGWDDLVRTIAGIRDTLSAEERASFGILVGNYGEAGAIENLGAAYHLPPPISLTNSFYLRSYPVSQPSTVIVVGWSRGQLERDFIGCRLAGRNGNSLGVKNEESQYHRDIYVCGPPRKGWAEFWKGRQRFG